jgi:23S rRNA (guanine2535-N1)-methyltransferase
MRKYERRDLWRVYGYLAAVEGTPYLGKLLNVFRNIYSLHTDIIYKMQYQYAKKRLDYSDLSSGRVFYSLPGHPAFPVRLSSEIFQHCMAIREATYKVSTPCVVYDPCCGAGYSLSVLGYLHGETIHELIGSDVDEKAVALAKQNLGLLNISGLNKRIDEISEMLRLYGKESHKEALASSHVLQKRIESLNKDHQIMLKVFQADVFDSQAIQENIKGRSVDIVFTDIPYGQHSQWQTDSFTETAKPVWSMLNSLMTVLSPTSIVAIVSDKEQKIAHENYQRVKQFQIGKRRAHILKPI